MERIYRLLVVLQNPWAKEGFEKWNPGIWKKKFKTSFSGKRLFGEIIPPKKFKIYFTNANPTIGKTSSSNLPPIISHIQKRIDTVRPDIILARGKNAHSAVISIGGGVVIMPIKHPAHRLFSKEETAEIRATLERFEIRDGAECFILD
ncbi:MAG: uracil-DNA glycosylase family protein [Patescibacteria group bacterium]